MRFLATGTTITMSPVPVGARLGNSGAVGSPINGGGQTNTVVHHVIIPPVPEIVASGVSYHLELDNFANGANGFCQATVTYNTDG